MRAAREQLKHYYSSCENVDAFCVVSCVFYELRGHVNQSANLPLHILEAAMVKLGAQSKVRNLDH